MGVAALGGSSAPDSDDLAIRRDQSHEREIPRKIT